VRHSATCSLVHEWATEAMARVWLVDRCASTVRVLHSIFERAVHDQIILLNPCQHTGLPKIVPRRARSLDELDHVIAAVLNPTG
jgi:hypothetical protein